MSDRASSLQQAMSLHRAGRVQDAARVYGAMLAANPHDADAAHLLGVALGQLGQPAEACSLIRIALQRYPHDPLAHLNLGNALAAMGDAAPALASYVRAAQLRPDCGDAHWACARLQRQLGRHAETRASLDRLLALQPRRVDAWTERGGVLLDLDRPEEALPDLERALALDARQTAARALRGRSRLRSRDCRHAHDSRKGDCQCCHRTVIGSPHGSRSSSPSSAVGMNAVSLKFADHGSQEPPDAGAADGYHILQIRPPGYVHAEALTELALTIYFGLRRLGLRVWRDDEPSNGRPIVFGAHLLGSAAAFPDDAIVFNTEQITPQSPWLGSAYLERLHRHEVWDYSGRNVERLRGLGVPHVRCVPVGYVPELARITPAAEDIDVLFYGSLNERRKRVLEELARRGLKVVHLFGVYGAQRDAMIARAKIVLNLHFYESKIFEIVRISYLLSNCKAVVAECDSDTEIEPELREAVCGVGYAELTDACAELVRDTAARRALGLRGHAIFSRRRAENALARTLSLPPPANANRDES